MGLLEDLILPSKGTVRGSNPRIYDVGPVMRQSLTRAEGFFEDLIPLVTSLFSIEVIPG